MQKQKESQQHQRRESKAKAKCISQFSLTPTYVAYTHTHLGLSIGICEYITLAHRPGCNTHTHTCKTMLQGVHRCIWSYDSTHTSPHVFLQVLPGRWVTQIADKEPLSCIKTRRHYLPGSTKREWSTQVISSLTLRYVATRDQLLIWLSWVRATANVRVWSISLGVWWPLVARLSPKKSLLRICLTEGTVVLFRVHLSCNLV